MPCIKKFFLKFCIISFNILYKNFSKTDEHRFTNDNGNEIED